MKKKWFNDQGLYRSLFKWLRVMKLTVFFLLVALIQVSASVYSQQTKLSISLKNATVREVLRTIEDQSEFFFLYKNENIDVNRIVNVDIKEKSVETLLDQVFKGTTVSYEVVNRQIVLIDKQKGNLFSEGQQQKSVSGKVTDSSGSPLPGVSVVVKGTTTGNITDANGNYTISNVPENAILQFSFVGMKSQEVTCEGKTKIDVTLVEDAIGIDEVVAVGYGTQKKVNLTGSVSTVDSKNLVQVVSTSTSQALQGRMSGVQISQNNGSPGSGSTIKIRGIGSLKSNNSPLIVVDGFIGSLDDISASDIESISVLKDAASSAIYGARAANGVILVTTKRGKLGRMTIDFKSDYGIQSLTKIPDFLNAQEYAQKQNEERIYGKQQPYWTGDLAPEKLGQGTDWYRYIFDNKSPIQNYHLGISGGSESTKYAISLGYIDQEGIILGSSYDRTNLRANFDHEFNKKIKLGVNIDLRRSNSFDETGGMANLAKSVMTTAPTVPINFPDGSPGIFLPSRPGERSMDGYLTPNLVRGSNATSVQGFLARTSLFLEIELFKGLTFKSVFNKKTLYRLIL